MARHAKASSPATNSELSRDVYGFTVRPHHFQRYKKYAAIYKEEEAERSLRWERFLTTYCQSRPLEDSEPGIQGDNVQTKKEGLNGITSNGDRESKLEMWGKIRPSLWPVEHALVSRFKKDKGNETTAKHESEAASGSMLAKASSSIKIPNEAEELYVESLETLHSFSKEGIDDSEDTKEGCSWRDELDALVQGGVPMALRGELWQVFVGTRHRRTKGHYQALLTLLADGGGDSDGIGGLYKGASANYSVSESGILEKWTSQIEKDLPRTFPGHPALDEDGRNALRRLLTAYARHNPDVGYCQAMNFFAALLLLMMPEENAFWTLAGFIDDYFEGYYSEMMLESQVDQLVLEVLVRRHFPRLVTHLDELGVQVAWVTGPWFLSVFVNILPWETVLRVWDVLLYDGNRSILFRTALALLEQHGSKIMATKDAGDAVTVLQSSASSTFDSSQLVLIACMGYQSIDDRLLEEIRLEKRPQILAALSERMPTVEHSTWQNGTRGVSSKKCNSDTSTSTSLELAEKVVSRTGEQVSLEEKSSHQALENGPSTSCLDGMTALPHTRRLGADAVDDDDEEEEEETCVADLVEQVKWLKAELSRALQECREATSRADELETAFMELVKEDNRRLLSAKVEALEAEVALLRQALNDKEQEGQAMVKVVLRMEQEQRLAEDARRLAEEHVAAQRVVMSELQRKYESAISSIVEMEKRAVMAETMLEATLQYQALDSGHVSAPRTWNDIAAANEDLSRRSWPRLSSKANDASSATSTRPILDGSDPAKELLRSNSTDSELQKRGTAARRFSLGWIEKAKGKTGTQDALTVSSPSGQGSSVLPGTSPRLVSRSGDLKPYASYQDESRIEASQSEGISCSCVAFHHHDLSWGEMGEPVYMVEVWLCIATPNIWLMRS